MKQINKMASSAENVAEQCLVLRKENRALLAGIEKLEDLVELVRQKPSPKKGSIQKYVSKITAIGRHKGIMHTHYATKSLNPMAPPWKLKKGDKDNLSTAMEL